MFKIFALLLIVAGFALGGRCFAAFHTKRVDVIKNLILMLLVIETQLRYARLPVSDLLRVLDENISLSELKFIKSCRERVCFGEMFPDAWKACVEDETELCRLLGNLSESLAGLGEDIGSTDLEGQLSCCEYYRQIFGRELEAQEEKSKKYSKLFPSLGLMLGISAAILFI